VDRLTKAYEEAKKELKAEIDLRSSAQAHVKSLQKSMMESEGGSAVIKERLSEAHGEIKRLQDFYKDKLDAEASSWRTNVEELKESISYLRNSADFVSQVNYSSLSLHLCGSIRGLRGRGREEFLES